MVRIACCKFGQNKSELEIFSDHYILRMSACINRQKASLRPINVTIKKDKHFETLILRGGV